MCLFQTPFGQIHLRDARIEDVDSSDDSDDEADGEVLGQFTIAIWPPFHGPTYLRLPSKHEKVELKLDGQYFDIHCIIVVSLKFMAINFLWT